MSATTLASPTPAVQPITHATGPKTPQGKAAASHNAVTHGLHAQDVVLTHLGESQEEFEALSSGLARELSPRTAVERHYVTQIAQAMWRLRRLTRWETNLYDDPTLTDEDRITKMARVLRHDAALRRHIDRALKALAQSSQNCQNEPAPASTHPLPQGEVASLSEPEGSLPSPIRAGALRKAQKLRQQKKCQNEPV